MSNEKHTVSTRIDKDVKEQFEKTKKRAFPFLENTLNIICI